MKFFFILSASFFLQYGISQNLQDTNESKLEATSPLAFPVKTQEETPNFKVEKPTNNAPQKAGILIENKDERIDLLIQDYTDNKKNMGFRIQLFSGSARWEAVKVKSDFLKKYKEEKSPHLVYQAPNFKIRVGDYRDRFQAQKYLEIYKIDYPSAFIVKDEIEFDLSD